MNTIGYKISTTRKSKGLTQEELAEMAKVNLRTIQRIENNTNEPRGKTLNLICDVLQIDIQELLQHDTPAAKRNYTTMIINGIFLIILNMVLMGIFGFLTLDSEANLNSRFGGILLSFFIPLFIVYKTMGMSGTERLLKFGSGFIVYFATVCYIHGFPPGFISGLFVCLGIALSVLFYGNSLIKK